MTILRELFDAMLPITLVLGVLSIALWETTLGPGLAICALLAFGMWVGLGAGVVLRWW